MCFPNLLPGVIFQGTMRRSRSKRWFLTDLWVKQNYKPTKTTNPQTTTPQSDKPFSQTIGPPEWAWAGTAKPNQHASQYLLRSLNCLFFHLGSAAWRRRHKIHIRRRYVERQCVKHRSLQRSSVPKPAGRTSETSHYDIKVWRIRQTQNVEEFHKDRTNTYQHVWYTYIYILSHELEGYRNGDQKCKTRSS